MLGGDRDLSIGSPIDERNVPIAYFSLALCTVFYVVASTHIRHTTSLFIHYSICMEEIKVSSSHSIIFCFFSRRNKVKTGKMKLKKLEMFMIFIEATRTFIIIYTHTIIYTSCIIYIVDIYIIIFIFIKHFYTYL